MQFRIACDRFSVFTGFYVGLRSGSDLAVMSVGGARFQSARSPWNLETVDPDFRQRMTDSILGFSIKIESMQRCWKLNQHHSESRRAGALTGLRTRAAGDDLEIADLMEAAIRR